VIVHSALGAEDPRISATLEALRARGLGRVQALQAAGRMVGAALAEIVRLALAEVRVPRLVVCGGDTACHVMRQLGIQALQFVAPLAPTMPVCRAYAPDRSLDRLQVVLKGGQMGADDFLTHQVRSA
jgi:uncharacterized protein YgbK (DUF1537 family)